MISFSYGTLWKQNAFSTTDISVEGTTVAEPLHTQKHHPREPDWLSFHTYVLARIWKVGLKTPSFNQAKSFKRVKLTNTFLLTNKIM